MPGGIERAIVNTANLFSTKEYRVTILIADKSTETFYPLLPGIHLTQEPLHFGITDSGNIFTRKLDFLSHISRLKKIIETLRPQVIIGTEYQLSIAAYLAAKKSCIRVYAWEHHHFYLLKKNKFWSFLFKKIYPSLTAVVCLNNTEKRLFEQIRCNAVAIPNFIRQQNRSSLQEKNILSIGWLIQHKGFDRVPEIAEKIFRKHPDWKWTILGKGELEHVLKIEIKKRKLEDRVFIIDPTSSDLHDVYNSTSVYVLTSRFECFPMVLLEAMSHGVPVLAFDCPTGPSFIIQNEIDGLLIEEGNVNAMAGAIIHLMEDAEKRNQLGSNAFENIRRFSEENSYYLWKNLFNAQNTTGSKSE